MLDIKLLWRIIKLLRLNLRKIEKEVVSEQFSEAKRKRQATENVILSFKYGYC